MRDRSRIVGYSYLKRLWKSRPSLADSSFWLGPPADLPSATKPPYVESKEPATLGNGSVPGSQQATTGRT